MQKIHTYRCICCFKPTPVKFCLKGSKDTVWQICQRCGVKLRRNKDIYKSIFYDGYEFINNKVRQDLVYNFLDKLPLIKAKENADNV